MKHYFHTRSGDTRRMSLKQGLFQISSMWGRMEGWGLKNDANFRMVVRHMGSSHTQTDKKFSGRNKLSKMLLKNHYIWCLFICWLFFHITSNHSQESLSLSELVGTSNL